MARHCIHTPAGFGCVAGFPYALAPSKHASRTTCCCVPGVGRCAAAEAAAAAVALAGGGLCVFSRSFSDECLWHVEMAEVVPGGCRTANGAVICAGAAGRWREGPMMVCYDSRIRVSRTFFAQRMTVDLHRCRLWGSAQYTRRAMPALETGVLRSHVRF